MLTRAQSLTSRRIGTKIEHALETVSPRRTKLTKPAHPTVEVKTLEISHLARKNNLPVSGKFIAAAARDFAKKEGNVAFTASNEWLEKWLKQNKLEFQSLHGESASVNPVDLTEWARTLSEI